MIYDLADALGIAGVKSMDKIREAMIRERAYHIWLEEGKPTGRDQAHWDIASKEVEEAQKGEKPVPNGGETRHLNGRANGRSRGRSAPQEGDVALLERRVQLSKKWPPRSDDLREIKARLAPRVGAAVNELDRVIAELAKFYSASKIAVWLEAEHPELHGERAIDLVHGGRVDEVLAVIESLADGTYT